MTEPRQSSFCYTDLRWSVTNQITLDKDLRMKRCVTPSVRFRRCGDFFFLLLSNEDDLLTDNNKQRPAREGESAYVPEKFLNKPSSWWKGSFRGFSSRDFRTPWVGGMKVGFIWIGLAIFSIKPSRAAGEQSLQRLISPRRKERRHRRCRPARGGPRRRGGGVWKRRRSSERDVGALRGGRTVNVCWSGCCRGRLAEDWRRRAETAELWRSLYSSPSMCGDRRQWRQSTGGRGRLLRCVHETSKNRGSEHVTFPNCRTKQFSVHLFTFGSDVIQ